MDKEALTKYWASIERLGIIPLIAEIEGKVAGHLDVIFGDELPLGRFLYLDVLMVHKACRRRGAATALIEEAQKLARDREVGLILVQPQQYEGPSGLTYRSCGFERAFEPYNLETSTNHAVTPSDAQLISVPQTQSAPAKTHMMVCEWHNLSVKTWDYGVNLELDDLHALPRQQLALAVLTGRNTYFFHVARNQSDHSKGSLHLWAPTPLEPDELHHIFLAARTVASWLGIKSLATRSIEEYLHLLEEEGFITKSKAEPYLAKRL